MRYTVKVHFPKWIIAFKYVQKHTDKVYYCTYLNQIPTH